MDGEGLERSPAIPPANVPLVQGFAVIEDLVFFGDGSSDMGVVVHVVVEDVVGIQGGGGKTGIGAAGVVGFELIGLGLGVDADVRCCSRAVVGVGVISSVIFPLAVQPFVGIGGGGFFEYGSVKRRIEALGDGVAGKEFNEKVGAIGGGDDGRPSGIGFVLIDEGAGRSDGESGD